MGAVPTAAAIWCEAGYAAQKIVEANAAKNKDAVMLENARELFSAGNYKQAVIYSEKATAPTQANILSVIILTIATGAVLTSTGIIYHYSNDKNKKKEQDTK